MNSRVAAAGGIVPHRGGLEKFKKWIPLYLMILPGAIYLFINNYIPMAGIIVAFKKYDAREGIWGSPFIGFNNFKFLFTNNSTFEMTRNTLLYNFAFMIINTVMGILIAILITEVICTRMKKIYQSAIMLPFLMSIVIVSYIVFAFLSEDSGIMNKTILPLLGMNAISWYSEPGYWPFILILVNTWKVFGYGCLIYIASIVGIDKSLFEAAEIDGAGKLKQIRYVTLPSLIPVVITLTLLSIGRIFYSDFGLFYQVPLNSGLLYSTTNVIDTQVYRSLLTIGDIGMSSAASFFQSIIGFILVFSSNWIVGRISRENSLF